MVPHPRAYYLASQLQQLGGWGMIDLANPIRRLLDIPCESASALTWLEAGYMHLDPRAPTVKLLNTLWFFIRKLLGMRGFLTHTPLWRNRQYKEILKLKGFKNWEEAGIKYISQLYNGPSFKSFMEIQDEFGISRTNFYKNLVTSRHTNPSKNH